jgi:hypothetical protein
MDKREDTNPGTTTPTRALKHYFEYSSSGVQVVADGLQEVPFGEFLVEKRAVTRNQLFEALQLQDKEPDKKLGECMYDLGYLPASELLFHLEQWHSMETVLI